MKLLLDTHIWIWMMNEPRRLAPKVRQQLQKGLNELWVSPASTWEVLLLSSKGKIQFQPDPRTWILSATQELREAPLTHEIVMASQNMSLTHPDPADRFLAGTAKVLGLTLVTSDLRLLQLTDIATLSNRAN